MAAKEDWFEDDEFWAETAPFMFHEQRLANAPLEAEQVCGLLDLSAGGRILDLCCGPGRHSLALARQGFAVTGIDRTRRYLEQARRLAQAEDLEIEFVKDDMRRYRADDRFDAAISLYTSFGFFDDPQDDRRVIENLYASLRKGGGLVIETMGKEVLARLFRERDWSREENGTLFLEERKILPDWSGVEIHWILVRDGKVRDFPLRLRLYSAVELSGLLRECGFHEVTTYGTLAGDPYDHQAKRLVAVARK